MSAGVIAAHYVASASTYDTTITALSPILRYKLNETSGTTFVNVGSKGSGFNGTQHGTLTLNQASLGTGLPGGCVLFDGTTGYIQIPAGALASLSAVTVIAWIKTTTAATNVQIVTADTSTNRLWQWRTSTSGTHQELIIPITATARAGAGTINNGAAHMLGFTYTSGAKTLYRDGVSDFSIADTGAIATPDNGLAIGASLRGPGGFIAASIQEVAVFASALAASDIAALYAAGA